MASTGLGDGEPTPAGGRSLRGACGGRQAPNGARGGGGRVAAKALLLVMSVAAGWWWNFRPCEHGPLGIIAMRGSVKSCVTMFDPKALPCFIVTDGWSCSAQPPAQPPLPHFLGPPDQPPQN